MSRADRIVETLDAWIVERPRTIVVVFLVATAVFAVGLGNVSTEAGTSQFAEDEPAQQAFEEVNERFEPPFAPGTGSTQLIQRSQNVLARESLRRMLEAQRRLADRPGLRVSETVSAARTVATTLDSDAATLTAQVQAVEGATEREIDRAVGEAASNPGFTSQLSTDFNPQSATASATVGVVRHALPAELATQAGAGGESPLTGIQQESRRVVASAGGDIRVFGSGLVSAEFSSVIFDSLILVVPAAALLILAFLVVAYRDPVDLLLGVVALVITIVWTFGVTGLLGLPFTQMLIAIPPLLLAVGIDFGIHSVNRYREERVEGAGIEDAMSRAGEQLLVAFFIVSATTILGFSSNVLSDLGPIRDFGLVASAGIAFTFLIFGIFLPAAKVWADEVRERRNFPQFGRRPLGQEGSLLGRALSAGVLIARRAPRTFLVAVVVFSVAFGYYGTGVDTSFSNEDFLPPEERPAFLETLPEPFRPSEYTVTETINFLEDTFASAQTDTVVIYVQGPLREDFALQALTRATRDPPDSFVSTNRTADPQSVVSVIRTQAARSPDFRRLVERNDVDDDGVPDDNLGVVYDRLLDSPARDRALTFVTEDRRAARVVYSIESDASQREVTADARALADRYRFRATATGEIIVFQAIAATILGSALRSLLAALVATALFLVLIYYALERRPLLGVVNLFPILVTVTLIAGSMRALNVPFNALTATILSITIGLGVDYSAHIVHRFVDEYEPGRDIEGVLRATVIGTGGALTGSMLTTTTGIGVLVLAITPILGQFGIITALSIFYSYLTALLVTPAALVLWEQYAVAKPD